MPEAPGDDLGAALLSSITDELDGVKVGVKAEPVEGDRIEVTLTVSGTKVLAPFAVAVLKAQSYPDERSKKLAVLLIKQVTNAARGLHSDGEGNPLPVGETGDGSRVRIEEDGSTRRIEPKETTP